MKKLFVSLSVSESAEHLKKSLLEKGFTIFCDIDHQANAKGVDLDMPESRVLIFGNPMAGTKLMQNDITMSLDLPLRIAIVELNGKTLIIHQTSEDYCNNYQVKDHPVLEKIDSLFDTLVSEL
ncbi:MAG: DUF302 domain-containing protein [Pseudomonadota bacterium]